MFFPSFDYSQKKKARPGMKSNSTPINIYTWRMRTKIRSTGNRWNLPPPFINQKQMSQLTF
jgi:hypothetical protein